MCSVVDLQMRTKDCTFSEVKPLEAGYVFDLVLNLRVG